MSNSKLARRLRVKLQLRDKKGRWIEMGRGAKWLNFDGQSLSGVVVGSKGNIAIVRQKNPDGTLGSTNINVHMKQLEMINEKANLDPATIELVNQFKNGQGAKGQKESAAREEALAKAKAAGEGQPDLAEISYEVSLEEELEDAYTRAPSGSTLTDSSGKYQFTKGEDGNWASKSGTKYSSKEMSMDDAIAEHYTIATGDKTEQEIASLFEKITEEYNDPDDEKATIPDADAEDTVSEDTTSEQPAEEKKKGGLLSKFGFGKKKEENADPVAALDETTQNLIKSTDEQLAKAQPQESAADPVTQDAPIDISQWKYHQGTQGGSNPGGIYTDTEGNDHYVKKSKSDMHAKNEVMADKFYEKLGIKTSQLKLADVGNGKLGTSSKMVEGSKNDFYSKAKSDPEYLKKFQEDFATDAWLANWDVVGLEYDNVLTDADGNPIRIDPGGALLYRAMGSPKGDMFGEEVGEWESMRNGSNPASNIFGSMTDEQLKASVAKLQNISEQDIADIVDSMEFDQEVSDFLKSTLSARRKNLLAKYPDLESAAPENNEQMDAPENVDTSESATDLPEATFEEKKQKLIEDLEAGLEPDLTPFLLPEHKNILEKNAIVLDWDNESEPVLSAYEGSVQDGGLTDAELQGLSAFIHDSADLNSILRNKYMEHKNSPYEFSENAMAIQAMDQLVAKSIVQEDTTVYRGIRMNPERFKQFMDAKMYSDKGFSSTSVDEKLALDWGTVDPQYDNKVEVMMDIQLPKGFTAHRIEYLGNYKSFANESEVVLPRNTDFDIVGVEEYTGAAGAKAYRLKVTPILNEKNYKPEGESNGSELNGPAEDTGTAGDSGTDNGPAEEVTGPQGEADSDGGGYSDPDSGGSTAEEGSEPSTEGAEDPAVTPEAPETEAPVAEKPDSAAPADEETIAPINGAKVMQELWASKEGLSVEAWKEKHNVPESGLFPNKNKTVSNENGDEFVANAIVSNPKFGQGIAAIILPSTNSVKVLYGDHGYKVTQAKNLSLVNDDAVAPDVAPDEALDLSNAKPGDVGTNPVNGKMYFVGKDGNALYIGDDVQYTKKGVTQSGKVSSIYKGAQTVKVDWEDGSSSVKKASQIFRNPENSNEDSDAAPETQESVDAPEVSEETAPETAETAPSEPVDAPETTQDTDPAPEAQVPAEAAPEATSEAENKGWLPADPAIYDPMGPTKVQLLPNGKANVYAHDHSGNAKSDYAIKGTTGFNPIEQKHFGVGANLQPLYVGDDVDYLWLGKKYKGKIVQIMPNTNSAKVELEDGTLTVRKIGVLRGNYPKTVDVDENGNYTDWHGNAANIPTLKKEDNSQESSEASEPEAEPAPKLSYDDLLDAPTGSELVIDGTTWVKGNTSQWYGNGTVESQGIMNEKVQSADSVELTPSKHVSLIPNDALDDLGKGAQIHSELLGITLTKDSDGDWLGGNGVGYSFGSQGVKEKFPVGDWEITDQGQMSSPYDENALSNFETGKSVSIGGKLYVKSGSDGWGSNWLDVDEHNAIDNEDMASLIEEAGGDITVRDAVAPNLDYSELEDLHTGAIISSSKLGITVEKDSDGDWNTSSYITAYMNADEVLQSFPTDDWVIDSKGQKESNYSGYDLDSAPKYSELYSPEHEAYFQKDENGWLNSSTGIYYTAENLLDEFADDEFTLSESEIDDDFHYGQPAGIFEDLAIGSKVSYTESPFEGPGDYEKIDENKWKQIGYGSNHEDVMSDADFEDGYSWVFHEAEEGDAEPLELLDYESNHPDIETGELTAEWAENTPVGTMFKSSLSNKWTYLKDEDGKFYPLDEYGQKKADSSGGTPEQLAEAGEKYSMTKVFVPESESTEESPKSVADFPSGTVVQASESTSFTKDQDGNWKLTINGKKLGMNVPEETVQEAHDRLNAEVISPEANSAEVSASETDTPDAEITDEEATPSTLKISELTEESFADLPVGSKIFSGSGNHLYTKIGGNTWDHADETMDGTLNDDDFGGAIGSTGNKATVQLPDGSEDSSATDAPKTSESPAEPKTMSEYQTKEFDNLPIGSKIVKKDDTSKMMWEKKPDGKWGADFHEVGQFDAKTYAGYLNHGGAGDNYLIILPDSGESPESSPQTAGDLDSKQFADLPVGSTLIAPSGSVYTKEADNVWGGEQLSSKFNNGDFDEILGTEEGKTWKLSVPVAASNEPIPFSQFTTESFKKLGVGSVVSSTGGLFKYTKTATNEWTTPAGVTHTDSPFESLFNNPTTDSWIVTPAGSVDPAPAATPTVQKKISDYSSSEFSDLPLDTVLESPAGTKYVKTASNEWSVVGDNTSGVTFDDFDFHGGYNSNNWTVTEGSGSSSKGSTTKTLVGMTLQEISAAPIGSTLVQKLNGTKYTKTFGGNWKSENTGSNLGSSLFDPKTIPNPEDWEFTEWSATIDAPPSGVQKGIKATQENLDNLPVGATLKNEAGYGGPSNRYFVKQQDGSWQMYKKTAHTLQTGTVYQSKDFPQYGTWTASSPLNDEHFVTGLGEIGYVGDSVALEDGTTGTVLKVMKTGIKVQTPSGDKVTVKPAKITKGDDTFGIKGATQPAQPSVSTPVQPSSPAPDYSGIPDVGNFAGEDASKYDAEGLTMPSSGEFSVTSPAFTLMESGEPDTTNPLYDTPRPEEPPAPSSYPMFEPPALELPKWDSAEWLKKVEQRYLDNPNKAKATVQDSNKWTSIQNVLNGEKQNLSNLLDSKYLDEDLYNEAIAGIDAQNEKNAPLVDEHQASVVEAKQKYEAEKEAYLANYTSEKAAYEVKLAAWIKANPDPDAIKHIVKPPTSTENFTGGDADWTKAHVGTYTAAQVFESVKNDKVLGLHGLSFALDSDQVEYLDSRVQRIESVSGAEVLDFRFKVTEGHGKTLTEFFKKSDAKFGYQIYPPQLVLGKNGLRKELAEANKQSSGERYEYTHNETGAKIIYQRDPVEQEFNMNTNHNSVRILMPVESTPEDYAKVLEHLGINAKPSTEGDIRVFAENRLITLFGTGKAAISHKNLTGAQRKKALDDIKKAHNVTVEDLVFEPEPNGRVRFNFSPEKTEEFAKKFSQIKAFNHKITTSGSVVDSMLSIVSGPNPGLASTYHRWGNGIGFSGMSSGTDLGHGSGDYVYSTPATHEPVGGNSLAIHPKAVLRRTDIWANVGDQYGKKSSDGKLYGAMEKIKKHSTSLHEVMMNDTVSINDMMYISVSTHHRAELLERLKKKGILKINGIPIEEFVVTSGMAPPAVDYIPGIGVVPAGTKEFPGNAPIGSETGDIAAAPAV